MALLQVRNKGLYTAPNEFSAVPQGALLLADNCDISKDGIIEPRRGQDRVAQLSDASYRHSRFEFFQDQHMSNWTGGAIGYKSGSTWVQLSGTFTHPDALLARTKFLLAQNNLYLTTNAGVYRTDTYTTAPTLAGMFKGLDISLALTGSSGLLATANQTAYRILFGIRDANNTLILGAPSGRAVITNATGGSRDIIVTFTLPAGITTSHFFQVYRTKASGSATVVPDDEPQLVYENNPTAGEITAKVVTFTDSTTDDLRGASLYTNASIEGIAQANERPPMANDIEEFQNCIFYAKTKNKHRKQITILGTVGSAGVAFNNTITIAGTVYTFTGTEDSTTGKVALYGSRTTTCDTTNVNPTLTNVGDITNARVGSAISGTGIPASTFIGSVGATTIGMVNAAGVAVNSTATNAGITLTISDGTPAQNIFDTASSLVRVINRYATNTLVYAYYISNPDDLPGTILIEERGLGGASFAVIASAHGTAYNPVLPTSGTTVSSLSDDFQNAIMFSKIGKGEAVPGGNIRRVGSANTKILRIKKLRNSIFIFKDREGIYRLTGTDPTNFDVQLFDSSAKLYAPDSVEVVNNQIWCLCDQGITVVTESGVSVVSRPIEDLILDQFGLALNAVKYYSFGVGYDSERQYQLHTVSSSADTVPTQAFIFNVFTQAYTRWPITKSCGKVSPVDDKLYFGNGDTYDLTQERKNRNYTDYVDHGLARAITSFTGTSVYLNSTADLEAGDVLYQSASIQSLITAVDPAFVTVQDTLTTWTVASCTVYKSYLCKLEYAAVTGESPGMVHQFPELTMLFKAARFNTATLSFATDWSGYFEGTAISGNRTGLWGLFPWGTAAWGSTATSVPIRCDIPLEKQRGGLLRVRFSHQQGYGYFKLNGFSIPLRETGSTAVSM